MKPFCALLPSLLLSQLLGLLLSQPLAAYTTFDEIIDTGPVWSPLPADGLPLSAAGAAFRVVLIDAGHVRLELRNPGSEGLAIAVHLPSYQDPTAETPLRVAAHGEGQAVLAVHRADRMCTEAAVAFTRISVGTQTVTPRRFAVAGQLPGTRAYAVRTAWQHAGFRCAAVAYSATAADADTIDLRVVNRSAQPIHAEFQVQGWQRAGSIVPRLHLLPGVINDINVPGEAVDGRVAHANLAVWAVRVGEDRGPAMGSTPDDQTGFTPLGPDWRTIAWTEPAIAGFNPDLLAWRFTAAGVELRNRAPLAAGVTLALIGEPPLPPFKVTLAASAGMVQPLPEEHGSNLLGSAPHLAGQAVTAVPLDIASPPANALALRARWPDARFNPLTVLAAANGAADGAKQADVVIVNRLAIAVHAEWALTSYQRGLTNPRLHLAAGAMTTMHVDLSTRDALLPLAQVAAWNVRLGDDTGDAWCVAPTP